MKSAGLVLIVVLLIGVGAGCELFSNPDPVPYDPTEGGWTLVAENDFSSSVTTTEIPILDIEADPTAVATDGVLVYSGDSAPDDKIWLRTDYGYTNTSTAYKLYVEPRGSLHDDMGLRFHLWNDSFIGKLSADIDPGVLRLDAWGGGPSDEHFGTADIPSGVDAPGLAFELIIDGSSLTSRLIDLETSHEYAVVNGELSDLSYYDGHDIRLRLDGIGTTTVDNFRIYTR